MAMGGEGRCRGWRAGGVWRQAVLGLVLALWVGVVSGAPAAMQPSSSGDSGAGGEVGCARPLVDVVWGYLLTLLALSLAFWNAMQQGERDKGGKMLAMLLAVFMPLLHLAYVLKLSSFFIATVWYCHKMEYGRMSFRHLCSLLNPWSKSPTRILASCEIIIYVQKGVPNEGSKFMEESWIWRENERVEDESEGMVIGEDGARKLKSMQYERKELSDNGKLALLWGEYFSSECQEYKFLPEYNELKFLRGNSGFAVLAIAIQAVGYIYAVIFRSVKDLRVAPIEVIGLVLNIFLLIGASFYSTSNPCVRPLIIYMNEERKEKFENILRSRPSADFDTYVDLVGMVINWGLVIVVIFVCIPIVLYFVISLKNATNIMVVVPLIIFGLGLLMSILLIYMAWQGRNDQSENLGALTMALAMLLNIVVYVWAMIGTLHYWKSQLFNTRPQLLDLSQIIPFIG